MRRSVVLAVLLLLAVSAWPAQAQLWPTASPEPVGGERVVMDGVLHVTPPVSQGLCMVLDPGQLTVTVRRVGDAIEQRPVAFTLTGFMADPDAQITTPITRQDVTVTTRLNGGNRYCWNVSIDAPETTDMPLAQRGGYVQTIAVRMTLAPD